MKIIFVKKCKTLTEIAFKTELETHQLNKYIHNHCTRSATESHILIVLKINTTKLKLMTY